MSSFFDVTPPSKRLLSLCEKLGKSYKIQIIDCENVIYRDLGNGIDFELSGLDNPNSKSFKSTLFIWRNKGHFELLETIPIPSSVKTIEGLNNILESYIVKYSEVNFSD